MSVSRGSIGRQKEEEEEEEENDNEEAEDQGETESDDDEEDESDGVDLEEDRRKRVMIRVVSGEGRGISSSTAASYSSSSLCCQADECGLDLKLAKPYYKRHKVCERHAKAAVVLVNGLRQRFCQQCSRFHEISEFDGNKKSCRERLAGHNLRRRKAHSDSQERLDRNNQRSE